MPRAAHPFASLGLAFAAGNTTSAAYSFFVHALGYSEGVQTVPFAFAV